jgi:hypothetical protein
MPTLKRKSTGETIKITKKTPVKAPMLKPKERRRAV